MVELIIFAFICWCILGAKIWYETTEQIKRRGSIKYIPWTFFGLLCGPLTWVCMAVIAIIKICVYISVKFPRSWVVDSMTRERDDPPIRVYHPQPIRRETTDSIINNNIRNSLDD